MSVESATYISQLDSTLPSATDLKSEGDDHLRLIKATLKAQFPSLGATAITTTAADLNAVTGASSTGAAIKVTTQTATDNTTNAASTAMVQAAILASSGISASLPAQTGNSGKYLTTDGSAASWGTVPPATGSTLYINNSYGGF